MAGHHAQVDPPASRRTRLLLLGLVAPFAVLAAVGLAVLWPGGNHTGVLALGAPQDLVDATVVAVEERTCAGVPDEAELRCSQATVRVEEGLDDGKVITLPEQPESGLLKLRPGDSLVLSYAPDVPQEFQYAFADRERRTPLYLLTAIFVGAVVLLGRWRGVRALLGLALSGLVLVVFVLPALLEGSSPLAVALTGSACIAIVALYLAHGFNVATTTAVLGTLVSLALVGVLGALFVSLADFSGLATEEATYLQITAGQVDLRGLLLAGIVIGALGVLDDVTVTQVSAVGELRRANPSIARRDLYRSAVRIGRDHIASTVNTLVLAYAGASLPLLLLFTQANQGLVDVLNGEAVAVEVVRALVGSIGLVCSVPITTGLAALVVTASAADETGDRTEGPNRFRSRGERKLWGDVADPAV